LKVDDVYSGEGYFYTCIGCQGVTAQELGNNINQILDESNGINTYNKHAQIELVDIKYDVTSPRGDALIFSAQVIIRSKIKILLT